MIDQQEFKLWQKSNKDTPKEWVDAWLAEGHEIEKLATPEDPDEEENDGGIEYLIREVYYDKVL